MYSVRKFLGTRSEVRKSLYRALAMPRWATRRWRADLAARCLAGRRCQRVAAGRRGPRRAARHRGATPAPRAAVETLLETRRAAYTGR